MQEPPGGAVALARPRPPFATPKEGLGTLNDLFDQLGRVVSGVGSVGASMAVYSVRKSPSPGVGSGVAVTSREIGGLKVVGVVVGAILGVVYCRTSEERG